MLRNSKTRPASVSLGAGSTRRSDRGGPAPAARPVSDRRSVLVGEIREDYEPRGREPDHIQERLIKAHQRGWVVRRLLWLYAFLVVAMVAVAVFDLVPEPGNRDLLWAMFSAVSNLLTGSVVYFYFRQRD